MGRKREEFIRRSVFVLQRDLKLSFPKQTNQKGKKKKLVQSLVLLDPGGSNLRRLRSEPHAGAGSGSGARTRAHSSTHAGNRSVKG